ncbi:MULTISPECIES: hypothetical protein [unclassified Streptomyces]|uniref:hypothetical protein n=1 Tax=unclassified Streptomyces TaxID=2593676 RepID=UPI002E380F98|nr:hypothetical protein [Streptomyces sp. NBC_01724]
MTTEAGNLAKVTAPAYIAAFAPDKGESVNTLIADPLPGASVPPVLPPVDGFLLLDRDKFADSFAGDLPPAQAEFMTDSQTPLGLDLGRGGGRDDRDDFFGRRVEYLVLLDAAGGAVSTPAWRTKPACYLVATDDRMIPPPAQRDGRADRRADRGGGRQPRRLRLPARHRRQPDQAGRQRLTTPEGRTPAHPPPAQGLVKNRWQPQIRVASGLSGQGGAPLLGKACPGRCS